ncbi:TPA: phosphorylase [Clostridium perfringens]
MYKFLIAGHTKYGLKKDKLCKSVLKFYHEVIKEKVIISPWWEPTIFKGIESELIVDTSIKIWNCKLFNKNITYIKTGIGVSVCTDGILALGNSNCKKIIFIGSVGALDENLIKLVCNWKIL